MQHDSSQATLKALHDRVTWSAELLKLVDSHWEASTAARHRTRDAIVAHVNLLDSTAADRWKVHKRLQDATAASDR